MSETILSSRPRPRAPLSPLGPGERVINGRVYYSALWLGVAAFEPEAVKFEPADGDDPGRAGPSESRVGVVV
jgi:hypothetical protein